MDAFIAKLAGMVWTYPVVGLCLGLSLFYTIRLGAVQLRCFPHAIALLRGKYDNPEEKGHISHFQALSAALSGTIGIGNIAGVAIAIAFGGPGAVFWMWILGALGMATKFAECTLGTHYRDVDKDTGEVRGGPMHYIQKGLGKKWRPMALFYAGALGLGAFGFTCLFQSNQAAAALQQSFGISKWITAALFFGLGYMVILGGIKRIGNVASKIVPMMCGIYVLGALVICAMNADKIPWALATIVTDAFTGQAAAGGAFGVVVMWGVRRAIFSNEAGLGSASIAHAAVKTDYPVREGVVASLGPMIDTLVVCTATALVIIMSGFFGSELYQSKGMAEFHTQAPLQGNWIEKKEAFPETSDKTSYLREGASVYHYKAGDRDHDGLRIPVTTTESDGIRFSYYKESGDMAVRLLDMDGNIISTLGLMPGKEKAMRYNPETQESELLLEASGFGKEGAWNSVLLLGKMVNGTLGGLPENIQVEFVPVGRYVSWYLDRLQSVQNVEGVGLTIAAFDHYLTGFGSYFVAIAIFFFALSTMITWSYYGETAAIFCFGKKASMPYKWAFITCAFIGAMVKLNLVLNLSDIMLGLIVIPNAIALLLLSKKVATMSTEYFSLLNSGTFEKDVHSAYDGNIRISVKESETVVETEKTT